MNWLLNISTYGSDLEIAGPEWSEAASLLRRTGMDGFELYPAGAYDCTTIPKEIVGGVHLRFFVMLRQIWQNDREGLLRIFGSEDTVRHYYGGVNGQAVISCYRSQLELAAHFDVPYVVFHPVHYELEYVFNWQPPWGWRETVDLSAEIIKEAVCDTPYDGWILFENLWWPGNFRLDSTDEIDRLLSKVNWPKSGLVLDTGHLLNKNHELRTEEEAIAFLLREVEQLGDYRKLIKAVHLSKSLSGEAAKAGFSSADPFGGATDFWQRFSIALRHVRDLDRHEPFSHSMLGELFDLIEPDNVVFELAFSSLGEWIGKVERQKRALRRFFPECRIKEDLN
ncbi:MAG TPA: sugar phosphate isomerase/epimerase [Chlorobaculum parvum]|uniref:Sugar phosphate isomerase/epimerase n=1 Tax=Chlorobaculum parvum TaxID=274539 RepID=A0A7C5HGU1_9CHLB|nr:sugar phosphate isomerase/epimerase [Chlorobaculum parvum]